MAVMNGRITICDRCGEQVFSKSIGKGEMDGGYTRWNEFEPLPDGWKKHLDVGQLCPKCNEEYARLIEQFMNKEVE